MDREQFWTLVEAARMVSGGDCQAQAGHLVAALAQRSVDEVLAWDQIRHELLAESYRWELWGAAYLINGGCGDDGFDYFLGWLLSQGRAIWEAAVADPDSLAAHPEVRSRRPLCAMERPAGVRRHAVHRLRRLSGDDWAGTHRRGPESPATATAA